MIEGSKVNLRALELRDIDRRLAWVNDPEVARFLLRRYPMAYPAEESSLRARAAKMGAYDHVLFAIETKDGTYIGNTWLHEASPENRSTELGIMIGDKTRWGQGYGGDAICTLLRFAFDEMNLNRVALQVADFNERGIACYRRCGFVHEARLRQDAYFDGAYHDVLQMSILRDEFYALHGATQEVEQSAAQHAVTEGSEVA
jgi:RimJ/RimL family protein N-acetyltransferase